MSTGKLTLINQKTCAAPGCGAKVIWLSDASGRQIPVNAADVDVDAQCFDPMQHRPHFLSCETADGILKSEIFRATGDAFADPELESFIGNVIDMPDEKQKLLCELAEFVADPANAAVVSKLRADGVYDLRSAIEVIRGNPPA